ncbi:MAG: Fe-S metabolism protein SufE [Flavobacteriales bacterium]|mgnify:FL=1|nr:Fe-S metabolism protein SufE [Flavobacteriales bacterium]|tara:strand:- start:189 stop:605 length:417 start_codon:yes stop_codon:yes gene_type:complete
MGVNERAQELIDDFNLFEDWSDKYEYIISLGKDLPEMKKEDKKEENLVKGCQSQVWLIAEQNGGRVYFEADSDAIISKGICALLVRVFNGQLAHEIVGNDLSFIDKIGLKEHLSPNRSNGLVAMIKKIKTYALVYSNS